MDTVSLTVNRTQTLKDSMARITTAMASPAYSSLPPRPPFIALLAALLILHSATASPPPPPPPQQPGSECVFELVMFSPCLAFVSSPPNNLSATVPSDCCSAFSAALSSSGSGGGGGSSSCLCYLLREPRMLGFPIDKARVLSLHSACSQNDVSLEAHCSGSEAMPPSQNVTDSGGSSPPDSVPSSQPSPLMSLPPESHNPSTPPSLSPDSEDTSEKSRPPTELANRPLRRPRSPPTPPRSTLGLSTSATADRVKSSKCWYQMGSLVLSFLIHSST